jgi:serine/threonine protein kinase
MSVQRHSFVALGQTFVVDSEYQFVKELGQGAYGCVVAAKHRRSGEGCAIKKITNINTKVTLSTPPFRVLALIFGHLHTEDSHKAMSARDSVSTVSSFCLLHALMLNLMSI